MNFIGIEAENTDEAMIDPGRQSRWMPTNGEWLRF